MDRQNAAIDSKRLARIARNERAVVFDYDGACPEVGLGFLDRAAEFIEDQPSAIQHVHVPKVVRDIGRNVAFAGYLQVRRTVFGVDDDRIFWAADVSGKYWNCKQALNDRAKCSGHDD